MNTLPLYLLALVLLSGCATVDGPYNPVASATQQTFLLNETALAKISAGMTQDTVHQLMGDAIIIGYMYQKPIVDEASVLGADANSYKPLTIANPYKVEQIETANGQYTVEYYVTVIRQPDGKVSEDELVPLVFNKGILVAKGGDYLKNLRVKNPS